MGAWIETATPPAPQEQTVVAPHVGAWIETNLERIIKNYEYVAPHVGAWIETAYGGDAIKELLHAYTDE